MVKILFYVDYAIWSLTLERYQPKGDYPSCPFGAGPPTLGAKWRTTASFRLRGDKLHVLMCQEMQIRTRWGMLK